MLMYMCGCLHVGVQRGCDACEHACVDGLGCTQVCKVAGLRVHALVQQLCLRASWARRRHVAVEVAGSALLAAELMGGESLKGERGRGPLCAPFGRGKGK